MQTSAYIHPNMHTHTHTSIHTIQTYTYIHTNTHIRTHTHADIYIIADAFKATSVDVLKRGQVSIERPLGQKKIEEKLLKREDLFNKTFHTILSSKLECFFTDRQTLHLYSKTSVACSIKVI
jgi:hypothetical protein